MLLADARGVGTDAVHGLAVAVVVLLAADPALAGSLGLLLSVAATAGVLVVAPRIASRLGRLPSSLATLASVTLGAQLAVAPVLLAAVGEVPLASVPANLLAVPAAALASTVAGLAAIVALVHVGAGAAVVALADPPLRVVLAAARVPDLPVVSVHQPAVLLLAVAAAGWLLAPRRGALARVAIAGVALGAALLVPVARPLPAVLTVTAIDVGQGDAVLVEGGGARILVDGGPDEDTAAAWLRRRGIRRLDLVVLTHPHADHATGLPTVLDRLDVGAVWLRPVEGHEGPRTGAVAARPTSALRPAPQGSPSANRSPASRRAWASSSCTCCPRPAANPSSAWTPRSTRCPWCSGSTTRAGVRCSPETPRRAR